MWGEKFFGGKKTTGNAPSESERRIAADAFREADPATYSHAPIDARIGRWYQPKMESGDEYTREGKTYYALETKPELQQVAARMLKGILNVSDVVSARDGFYSHRIPMESLRTPTSFAEANADIALLNFFLGDMDHGLALKDGKQTTYSHNVRYEDGKAAYFDFAGAQHLLIAALEPDAYRSYFDAMDADTFGHLARKAYLLKDRFDSNDGKKLFFSILDASGKPVSKLFTLFSTPEAMPTEEERREFAYRLLIRNIDTLISEIENYRQPQELKRAA